MQNLSATSNDGPTGHDMSPPAPQTQWGMSRGPWGMPRGPSTGHDMSPPAHVNLVGDAAWPVDEGWRSAPASRVVLLLAWGATTATGVWVGVVATASATAVGSWT
jgi:hypothetical protein